MSDQDRLMEALRASVDRARASARVRREAAERDTAQRAECGCWLAHEMCDDCWCTP